MFELEKMRKMASSYAKPVIASLGSHSALDICEGAKREGFPTLVLCKKGREKVYAQYYKTRKEGKREIGVVDEAMLFGDFKEIAKPQTVKLLQRKQAIFVPHRSFSVYVGYDAIENEFEVPIFGNRYLLRAEERNGGKRSFPTDLREAQADTPKNQDWLLKEAGIAVPKKFKSAGEIDRLAIVKAPQAKRTYERAFFFASDGKEFERKGSELVKKGIATKEGVESALIEEVVLGAHYNFNFFYSPIEGRLELLGTDMRRQTNLDGILRLPAWEQMQIAKSVRANNVEVGHVACTIRESLLEKVFEAGEKFVKACRKHYAPGLIGPFALQGAVVPKENSEEIVIFDVSFRVPGSPGVRFTPYTEYLFGESISVGRRIAMEVKKAKKEGRMGEIVT